jgi:dienelactone hydrolase
MKLPRCRFVGRLAVVVLATVGVGMVATVWAQERVADFSAGQGSGRYAFASWTPKTLGDLLKGNAQHDTVNIVGHLFVPPGTEKEKVPAVVLMHGSGGVYSAMLDFWPKQFNAAGYAVLAVDSFGPRGVKSTADDQSQVPFAADVADAFAALRLAASHPRIDAGRIAIMGFSRGGITTWRAAVERVIAAQGLPDGLRFAAHVPVYSGGCVGAFRLIVKPGVFSKAPMLWIHGDADDYAPIAPCQDYADRIGKAGTPVEFVVIPGARHKFDSDDPGRHDLKSAQRTLEGCPVEIDIDTLAAYDRFTGQRLSGDAYQAALKTSCSAIGASVQGDRSAREKAAQSTLAFLRKSFAR